MTNIKRLVEIDGVLEVEYEWYTTRFLMSDGSTVDVRSVRDDSWLRDALLKHTGLERIEGSVNLAEPEPAPVKSKRPVKRAPRSRKGSEPLTE